MIQEQWPLTCHESQRRWQQVTALSQHLAGSHYIWWCHFNCLLLHRLLGLDLLLSLESIHVTLEEVAVGQLELVDILCVDDGGNFLVLVHGSHEAHVLCWSWVRRRGWRYLGILQQNHLRSSLMVNKVLTNFFAFLPFPVVGLCFGMGLVLPSYLFIQILGKQSILEFY